MVGRARKTEKEESSETRNGEMNLGTPRLYAQGEKRRMGNTASPL